MKTGQLYFLTVAEEENVSRAAQKLNISQQCLSNHIKHLEKEYGVQLFYRKPAFALTPAGKTLQKTLNQIKQIESSLALELQETGKLNSGTLKIGISPGRARIILPKILPQFYEKNPLVEINIINQAPEDLDSAVQTGELDLAVGVDIVPAENMVIIPLHNEKMYVALSDGYMKRWFSDRYPACKQEFEQGVDLTQFYQMPFILNHRHNTPLAGHQVSLAINNFLSNNSILINPILYNDDNELHVHLAATGCAACFCPQVLVPTVKRLNSYNSGDNLLSLFPVRNYHQEAHVALFHMKKSYYPQYFLDFISLTISYFNGMQEQAL